MKKTGKKRVNDGPIRKAGQGQLQCQQDSKDVTRVGSVKELPLCRDKPIFHEPVGAVIKDKEQLTAMYPNSFDRIGSLKGEYTIKIDPSIALYSRQGTRYQLRAKKPSVWPWTA